MVSPHVPDVPSMTLYLLTANVFLPVFGLFVLVLPFFCLVIDLCMAGFTYIIHAARKAIFLHPQRPLWKTVQQIDDNSSDIFRKNHVVIIVNAIYVQIIYGQPSQSQPIGDCSSQPLNIRGVKILNTQQLMAVDFDSQADFG